MPPKKMVEPWEKLRLQQRRSVVPLPGDEGGVSGFAQPLRERDVAGVRVRGAVDDVLVNAEDGLARHQLGAARHADATDQPPLRACVGESNAAPHQAVHIRGPHHGMAQRGHGVKALVVGKQENEVWPLARRHGSAGQRCQELSSVRHYSNFPFGSILRV